jgi:glutaredoxin
MNSKKPMIILSQPECQPCLIAKMELKDRDIDFIEVDVTEDTNVMWKPSCSKGRTRTGVPSTKTKTKQTCLLSTPPHR